jgi:hypothetical protein
VTFYAFIHRGRLALLVHDKSGRCIGYVGKSLKGESPNSAQRGSGSATAFETKKCRPQGTEARRLHAARRRASNFLINRPRRSRMSVTNLALGGNAAAQRLQHGQVLIARGPPKFHERSLGSPEVMPRGSSYVYRFDSGPT